jgi:hypothetical protein
MVMFKLILSVGLVPVWLTSLASAAQTGEGKGLATLIQASTLAQAEYQAGDSVWITPSSGGRPVWMPGTVDRVVCNGLYQAHFDNIPPNAPVSYYRSSQLRPRSR